MKELLIRLNSGLLQVVVIFLFMGCKNPGKAIISRSESLNSNWKMQAEDKLGRAAGEQISINNFRDDEWYNASVPGTVLGSLATFGVIEDPYFGINMQKVDTIQFRQPWWFRTNFHLSAADMNKKVSLRFNGINYRADLWVNGKKVAGKENFAGTYRMFTFGIDQFKQEGENTIALKLW